MMRNNLKYIAYLGFTTLLTVMFVFAYEPAIAQTPSFQPYQNSNLGLSLRFPSDWNAIELNSDTVEFRSPTDGSQQGQRVMITAKPDANMPMSQLADQASSYNQAIMPNYNLLVSEPITINDNSAYQHVYTYTDPQVGPTKAKDIFMTDGYYMYGITYAADPSDYEAVAPIVNSMINSMQNSNIS
jgi:hypothetical protein